MELGEEHSERELERTIVEYALKESNKPIDVAAYRIVKRLPANLKGKLPEPKHIEKLLEAVEIPNKDGAEGDGKEAHDGGRE